MSVKFEDLKVGMSAVIEYKPAFDHDLRFLKYNPVVTICEKIYNPGSWDHLGIRIMEDGRKYVWRANYFKEILPDISFPDECDLELLFGDDI